jgi:EmrB/QacA subfamily drug resistance transporter
MHSLKWHFNNPMKKERLIPLIVATALFMENMDSTVIATSLPAIAADIGTSPLTLKLAITSYLLSLAVFIPASGWTADRFGARMVFSIAIAVFMVGSIGCALSSSVTDFVIARIVQGIGGAMMTPVGRLVLLRSIDKSALVNAMAWVTVPALIGPVIGPPLGGFITTYFSWHWIFLINIPIGLVGIFMAMRYIDPIRSEAPERFDLYGLVLAGIGLAGIAFGLSVAGLNLLPWSMVAALVAIGTISMTLYVIHARRTASPVLDFTLLRLPTLRASIYGGFLFRLGIGALPFLLPLLMQVGFGLSPFRSGLVTFASAVGAMGMKTLAARLIRTFGFRNIMTINAFVSSVFLGACALFTPATPLLLIMILLVVGGFFRSLQFTAINTVAYAEVEPAQMSRATTLVSVNQQLAISAGVAVGAFCVESTMVMRHVSELAAADFAPAFIVVSIISAISTYFFYQMPDDAGHEISGRKAVEISSRKGAAKAAAKAANEGTEDVRDQRLG